MLAKSGATNLAMHRAVISADVYSTRFAVAGRLYVGADGRPRF